MSDWKGIAGSLWLDAREFDHLGPFLGFFGHECTELGRRHGCRHAAYIGKPSLHLGIGESIVDLLIEPINDLPWRASGCTQAIPRARLEARHEIAHSWDVWQRFGSRHACHGESA